MDRVVLCRYAHHFRPAPGDRADVAVIDAVRGDDGVAGVIDFLHGVGDFKAQNFGGLNQSLRMFCQLKDLFAVDSLAFEHAGRIVQAMRQDMQFRIPPIYQRAVHPHAAFAIVKRYKSHFFHSGYAMGCFVSPSDFRTPPDFRRFRPFA